MPAECNKRLSEHELSVTGLIADNHGNASALQKAINALAGKNIHHLVHLGDFLDSIYNERINDVILMLQKHSVRVIKGNNDYQVEIMLEDRCGDGFPSRKSSCLAFLQKTPIFHVNGKICYSHSMPYNSIRSFYEPIDNGTTDRAMAIFENTAHHVLFCGHSHKPVFFRYNRGNVTREQIPPGRRVPISSRERYIFIVGAAENGECGLYDRGQSFYEHVTFD